MKPNEKAALRRSVRQYVCQIVRIALAGRTPHSWSRRWACDDGDEEWRGLEVAQVCREVYREACKALEVKP